MDEAKGKTEWTAQSSVSIMAEEHKQCSESIREYNVQFLSSSAFITIVATVAGIVADPKSSNNLWMIFYVLPIVYFLALYNLIKYTIMQETLGAYKDYLEEHINAVLDNEGKPTLIWGKSKVRSSFIYKFVFSFAQIVFFVPLGIFILKGFYDISEHDKVWWFFAISLFLQLLIIVVLCLMLTCAKPYARCRLKNEESESVSESGILNKKYKLTCIMLCGKSRYERCRGIGKNTDKSNSG